MHQSKFKEMNSLGDSLRKGDVNFASMFLTRALCFHCKNKLNGLRSLPNLTFINLVRHKGATESQESLNFILPSCIYIGCFISFVCLFVCFGETCMR